MNAAEIREALDREPFEPLRIRISSGDAYEVRNPNLVVVMRSRLFVAFPDSDRWTLIPFLHIAAIESISNGSHPRTRRRKPRE
jgi:hypothetical protein